MLYDYLCLYSLVNAYYYLNEVGIMYNILRNYYEIEVIVCSVEIVNLKITYYGDLQWLLVGFDKLLLVINLIILLGRIRNIEEIYILNFM